MRTHRTTASQGSMRRPRKRIYLKKTHKVSDCVGPLSMTCFSSTLTGGREQEQGELKRPLRTTLFPTGDTKVKTRFPGILRALQSGACPVYARISKVLTLLRQKPSRRCSAGSFEARPFLFSKVIVISWPRNILKKIKKRR